MSGRRGQPRIPGKREVPWRAPNIGLQARLRAASRREIESAARRGKANLEVDPLPLIAHGTTGEGVPLPPAPPSYAD